MKTIESSNTVVNSPNLTSSQYKIKQKNLTKIINIVENDIYSDKILAVIREYSCNAYDANVSVGNKNTPIIVSLPSRLINEFKVRDNGPGLTEYEINDVYTSYGESTKDTSDEFIGTLGIGSKSGFAYGDNYVVTSWKNGTKTVYNAVKGATERQIVKLYSEPSSEPSGIEVSIPVKAGDETQFKNKSLNFFKNWQVQPQIFGVNTEEINTHKDIVLLSGNNWYIRKEKCNARPVTTGIAVMGNIEYPIDWQIFFSKIDAAITYKYAYIDQLMLKMMVKIKQFNSFITTNNFVIQFKIGDLMMSPSRESLQYIDHTVNNIVVRLAEICDELVDVIINKINTSNTMWEYKCNINSIFNLGPSTGRAAYNTNDDYGRINNIDQIYKLVSPRLKFNDVNVVGGDYSNLNDWDAVYGKLTPTETHTPVRTDPVVYTPVVTYYALRRGYDKLEMFPFLRSGDNKWSYRNSYNANMQIFANPNIHIMIMDSDRRSNVKTCIKWYIKENNVQKLYTLTFKNDIVRTAFFSNYDLSGATMIKFSQIFETYKSLIPKRQSVAKLEDDVVHCGALGVNNYFSYNSHSTLSDLWQWTHNVNLKNTSGYYVDVSACEGRDAYIKVNNIEISVGQFFKYMSDVRDSGLLCFKHLDRVSGFGTRIMTGKKFAKNKNNWQNFVEYIEKQLKNIDKSPYVVRSIIRNRTDNNSFYMHKLLLNSIAEKLPSSHVFCELNNIYPNGYSAKTEQHITIMENLGVKILDDQVTALENSIHTGFDIIVAKYPMLRLLRNNSTHKNVDELPVSEYIDEIVRYIKLVDKVTTVN
jgi:hypothetical protein